MTALMLASECGHEESVRALVEKGASLEAVDKARIPAKSTSESETNIQYLSIYVYTYVFI